VLGALLPAKGCHLATWTMGFNCMA
jgi:hypothetical protein